MSSAYSWRKAPSDDHHSIAGRYSPKKIHRKRKIVEDELPKPQKSTTRHYFQTARLKRTKTPRILGQTLPLNRLIEVLDHQSLQNLLQQVVAHHPEVAQTVANIAPKPATSDAVALMQSKLNGILTHLPYKCDVESDYSYIRIKPHLTEFLNCLSDFILSLLPPMDTSTTNACVMLDVITNMIHDLPNFSNSEFQYTKATAYEQIANSWLIVLSHKTEEQEGEELYDSEVVKTIQEFGLQAKVQKHNEASMGKFAVVADFIKHELDAHEQLVHSIGPSGSILSDLITVDYSNYSIAARTSH